MSRVRVGKSPRVGRRPRVGRPISVPKTVRSARDLIRQHLREEGYPLQILADWWNVKRESAYRYMNKGHCFSQAHINIVCEKLRLDREDTLELNHLAAREAGWVIQEYTP